jgi:hypothetical protein
MTRKFLFIIFSLYFFSCSKETITPISTTPTPTTPVVSKISIILNSNSPIMGSSIKATTEALDLNGNKILNSGIEWSLSNSEIASIDQLGNILTEYDGETYVKAKIGKIIDSVKITIQHDFKNWKTYFKPVNNGIPDLNSYYQQVGNYAFSTVLNRIDLNKDGRADLVLHLWRFGYSPAIDINAPVPNRLVALVSQTDGTFKDKTQEIFGTNIVDLAGGASRKARIADLNNDNYPDLVYALNREDSRPNINNNLGNESVAIISNGDGTYKMVPFGDKNFHHSVEILKTTDGRFRVVFENNEEYVYSNGFFTKSNSIPTRGGGTFHFFKNNSSFQNYLITDQNVLNNTSPSYLGLFKFSGSSWNLDSKYEWTTYRNINYVEFNGDISTNRVINYQGKEYISGGFFESNSIKLYPNTEPIPVVHFATSYIQGGTQGKSSINSNQTQAWSKLMAFNLQGGELVEQPIFSNPEGPFNINFFDVKDLNGDGFDDLATYPYIDGGQPRVYLNNQSGNLNLIASNKFPSLSIGNNYNSAFFDFDGDKIEDLLFFPGNGCSTGSPCTKWLLYKGRRILTN